MRAFPGNHKTKTQSQASYSPAFLTTLLPYLACLHMGKYGSELEKKKQKERGYNPVVEC